MTELNKDGLIPGQPVDFATIKRIENSRVQQKAEPETKPEVARRGRPAKDRDADQV